MWRWFRGHAKDEQDLNDEIQFHLAEETRLRIEAGGDPDEASASARRAFGNVTLVREVTRDAWGHRAFETVAQDVRHGVRLLARHRLFAAFSIVSLALGIGGTSAVFALYDTIVLRQLPVEAPDRLVTLAIHGGGRSNSFMPYPQSTPCEGEARRSTASLPEPQSRMSASVFRARQPSRQGWRLPANTMARSACSPPSGAC